MVPPYCTEPPQRLQRFSLNVVRSYSYVRTRSTKYTRSRTVSEQYEYNTSTWLPPIVLVDVLVLVRRYSLDHPLVEVTPDSDKVRSTRKVPVPVPRVLGTSRGLTRLYLVLTRTSTGIVVRALFTRNKEYCGPQRHRVKRNGQCRRRAAKIMIGKEPSPTIY